MSLQVVTTRGLSLLQDIPVSPSPLKSGFPSPVLKTSDVRKIAAQALAASKDGRATESWRRELEAIDRSTRFSTTALRLFQESPSPARDAHRPPGPAADQ